MKNLLNLKNVLFILLVTIAIVSVSVNIFAADVLDNAIELTKEDYQKSQETVDTSKDGTTAETDLLKDKSTSSTETAKITSDADKDKTTTAKATEDTTKLPQTGIEDYNIGILLIIGIASAIYAYKKINYYKNI